MAKIDAGDSGGSSDSSSSGGEDAELSEEEFLSYREETNTDANSSGGSGGESNSSSSGSSAGGSSSGSSTSARRGAVDAVEQDTGSETNVSVPDSSSSGRSGGSGESGSSGRSGSSTSGSDSGGSGGGNGVLTDAQQQNINAVAAEDVESVRNRQQGIEGADSQAGELEQQVLAENSELSEDDVRIDREGDRYVARLNQSGMETVGANPTDREIRQSMAAGNRFDADQFNVNRTDDGVEVGLSSREYGAYTEKVGQLARADPTRDEAIVNDAPIAAQQAVEESPTGDPSNARLLSQQQQRRYNERVVGSMGAQTRQRQRQETTTQTDAERDFYGGIDAALNSDEDPLASEAREVQVRKGGFSEFEKFQRGVAGATVSALGTAQDARQQVSESAQTIVDEGTEAYYDVSKTTQDAYYGLDFVPTPDEARQTEQAFYGSVQEAPGQTIDAAASLSPEAPGPRPESGPASAPLVLPGPAAVGTGARAIQGIGTAGRLSLLGGAGIAATEVDVPSETIQERSEFEQPRESITSPTEFDISEDAQPTSPTEFNVGEETQANSPTELGVPADDVGTGGGLSVSQLAYGDLDQIVDQERRRRDQDPATVPEEFIPDDPVVIGEDPQATEPEVEPEPTDPINRRDFSRPGRPAEGVVGAEPDATLVDEATKPQVTQDAPPLDIGQGQVGIGARPLIPPAERQDALGLQKQASQQQVAPVTETLPRQGMGLQQGVSPALDVGVGMELGTDFVQDIGVGVGTGVGDATMTQQAVDYPAVYENEPQYEYPAEEYGASYGTPSAQRDLFPGLNGLEQRDRTTAGVGSRRGSDDLLGFGYATETYQDIQTGGLQPANNPDQDILADIQATDPGADLPTKAVLSGEVDVGAVRDFFEADEVKF